MKYWRKYTLSFLPIPHLARLAYLAAWCGVAFFAPTAAAKTITLLANGDTSVWQYKTFDNIPPTQYRTIQDDTLGKSVLFADSRQGASGYVMQTLIALQKSPWLHFQWRIDKVAAGFEQQQKSGDDYAYRLYFIAENNIVGSRGIALVRANGKNGDTWKSPYSVWPHNLQIHVFAGTAAPIGEWRAESINLHELWQKIHGESPSEIQLIGLMSDSDSAGKIMQARYGGVLLSDSAESPFNHKKE